MIGFMTLDLMPLIFRKSIDTFWMRLKSVGPCTSLSIQQFAVLIYETSSTENPKDLKISKNPKKPTNETDSTSLLVDQAAFPDKTFLAFSESFGNGSVSSLIKINLF